VAAALHLSRQAERSKKICRLYIRGQHVDWKRIQAYLRKNKLDGESLAESDSCDAIPSYITFEFVDSTAMTPLLSTPPIQPRPGPMTNSSDLTPDSTPNGTQPIATASITEITPESSPNNSWEATTSHRHDLANGSQSAAFTDTALVAPPVETNQTHLPVQREHDQVGFWAPGELAGPIPELSGTVIQQFVGHLVDVADQPIESTDMFDLYRMMSVTPPSTSPSPRQSMAPLYHTDSSLYLQDHVFNGTTEIELHNASWVDDGFEVRPHVEPDTFQPLSCPAHFLSWSIAACLRKNEGMDHHTELAMKEASKSFKTMVASRHEKCLTSLNLLLALLEAHGKRDIAIELLGKFSVAALSLKHLPERESVLLTIRFKTDIMCGLKIDRMFDPAVLRQIHYRFERSWGPDSPSTLACLCNLGWRLAGDKDAGRLTEALDVLSRARVSLERTLGQCDPQTITCLTMLARVLYNLERHLEASEMMHTAMDRIIVRFPEYHPYRIAALRRYSLFMQKIRGGNAEPILREVASRRLRVLGPNCELTKGSIRELRDFLRKQGRHHDAGDAFRAITESASHMYCGETPIQSF
jgi:hypothetical protein